MSFLRSFRMSYKLRVERHGVCFLQVQQALESQESRWQHPQAIRDIDGADKHCAKTPRYPVAAVASRGVVLPTLFSNMYVKWHDGLRYAVQPGFNLSNLKSYEPCVNNTMRSLLEQLNRSFADAAGQDVAADLAIWMPCFAFDVMGKMAYGAANEFFESAMETGRIISEGHGLSCCVQYVWQMPWLDHLLEKDHVLLWLQKHVWMQTESSPIPP